MTEYSYKVYMYLMFVSGNDPDSFYPGEDKLWFEILLDEFVNGHYSSTIDCNGFELPIEFLHLSRRSREEFVKGIEDEIVDHVAVMLVRNGVDEYGFDGSLDLDWLDIANSDGVRFDDPNFEERLRLAKEW